MTFFCEILSFLDMIDFVFLLRDLAEIVKNIYTWFSGGGFAPPYHPPGAPPLVSERFKIDNLVGSG